MRLKADDIRPKQPLDDLAPPGQPAEQLVRWKGNMQEKSDSQIRPQSTQNPRDKLQLVIVHPHDLPALRETRRRPRESQIQRDILLPPLAMKSRRPDGIVI